MSFRAFLPEQRLARSFETLCLDTLDLGDGALFRVEIAAGQESVLRMGALKFLARQQPYRWYIVDQNMERTIGNPYANDLPKEPVVVPPGKYTIMVQTTQLAQPTALVKDLEVKPNSVVEVEF